MKASMILAASIAATLEQPDYVGFQPLLMQQQQAKSGTVIVDGGILGTDLQVRAIADSDPLVATLGSLAVSANRAAERETISALRITNNLAGRRLFVMDAVNAGDIIAGVAGSAGIVKSAELTFADLGPGPGVMSNTVANGTGLSTAINAALGPAEPSYTMSGIINKVEDLVLATEGVTDAAVIIDQVGEKLLVYTGTPAAVGTAHDTVLSQGEVMAGFLQDATPTATAEKEFGE